MHDQGIRERKNVEAVRRAHSNAIADGNREKAEAIERANPDLFCRPYNA